jgi:hypothetical protein
MRKWRGNLAPGRNICWTNQEEREEYVEWPRRRLLLVGVTRFKCID